MKVTRNDLRDNMCTNSQSWFNNRLPTPVEYKLVNGTLLAVYESDLIRSHIKEYLERLSKLRHLSRHKSDLKCKNLLDALNKFERNNVKI